MCGRCACSATVYGNCRSGGGDSEIAGCRFDRRHPGKRRDHRRGRHETARSAVAGSLAGRKSTQRRGKPHRRAHRVRQAERRHRRVRRRAEARPRSANPHRLLPDGEQAVAPGWRDDRQSVLRQTDVHLRQHQEVNIAFTKHTLANGLDVILHEDHSCPIVAVNVWYHVGSKNEVPGRTGFAHLFEHLMFEGSQHHDRGYFQPLQGAGASLNGSTNADRTNYWEVVPTNALDLALWMESDRMGYLLPALTDAKFSNQREVVLNERRQNYENRPYGLAGMAIVSALYPADHPYHWLTIGGADDIRAAHIDDVRAFFQRYYHPANASLTLAGDVDTEMGILLADEYFGDIAPGEKPGPVAVTAPAAPAQD